MDTKEIEAIRAQFPILKRMVNKMPLVYFDNGATVQKPEQVIRSMSQFYEQTNSNIHRGVHTLSRESTILFEQARETVARHFCVANAQQLIFTAGTTDSINMVAQGLAKNWLRPGDEIILSTYEHHSNILPWQVWAEENGGHLKVIPLLSDQSMDYEAFEKLLSPATRLIAVTHVSNTLGLQTDVSRIRKAALQLNIPFLLDGAQSAPHMKVDLTELAPDFFVCSGHKMYGPTGTGILYLSERWLRELPAVRTGGGTIKTVSFEKTDYVEGALRFEPGTPNIAGVIGFAAALDFLNTIGMDKIAAHEQQLVRLAQQLLGQLDEVEIYGRSENKAAVISFNVGKQHPFDVGTLLDKFGIAVRTGHHCTQPLMASLNIPGTVRATFAVYNTEQEVEFFVMKLKRVIEMLR
jgi:cysteine desulfurase / selenocysteine lyase